MVSPDIPPDIPQISACRQHKLNRKIGMVSPDLPPIYPVPRFTPSYHPDMPNLFIYLCFWNKIAFDFTIGDHHSDSGTAEARST